MRDVFSAEARTLDIFECVSPNSSDSYENNEKSGFLGNTSIQRQYIESVRFVAWNTNFTTKDNRWDVSEAQDGSVMAYYETGTSNDVYVVYIASNGDKLYTNTDSGYLFAYIGYNSKCQDTETIQGLDLLNTSYTVF